MGERKKTKFADCLFPIDIATMVYFLQKVGKVLADLLLRKEEKMGFCLLPITHIPIGKF